MDVDISDISVDGVGFDTDVAVDIDFHDTGSIWVSPTSILALSMLKNHYFIIRIRLRKSIDPKPEPEHKRGTTKKPSRLTSLSPHPSREGAVC